MGAVMHLIFLFQVFRGGTNLDAGVVCSSQVGDLSALYLSAVTPRGLMSLLIKMLTCLIVILNKNIS